MRRDLVERAMSGDHDAFAELASASIGRLFSVARLILRDDGRAEDATQDALVAAWRDLSALRDPDKFEAWLHRLLVRACYREAGRNRRQWDIPGEVRSMPLSERDLAVDFAARDEIARGFQRLQPDQRAILVLHFYLGLSLDEASEVLAVPPGTVRSRLHRAMAGLRAALEADARTPTLETGRTA